MDSSSALTFLCTIHHVIIGSTITQSDMRSIGQHYTIELYVAANEILLLQCFPDSLPHVSFTPEQHPSLPEMTINIASQSEVHLEKPSILIVPHLNGESWSLDCSASDAQEFTTLQDMLTHFTKFENRQNIRNTLAMVSPSSYHVTRVVAENISLDPGALNGKTIREDDQGGDGYTSSVVDDDDDFIATRENYYGQKLPVTMDEHIFQGGLELRKVRLINKTSQCMEVSSVWLARGIISAGDSIAGYIQSGSTSSTNDKTKTATTTQLISSKQRRYFDIVFNITSMIGNMAGEWFSKLFKQASVEFRVPTPTSQLGNTAFQAAHRVMEGSLVAAGTVLSASRQELVKVIEKKYGADAGYMAGKIVGSDKADEDVMVYFDNHGISRKVVMNSALSTNIHQQAVNESSTSFVIYEEGMCSEKSSNYRQVVYDIEEFGGLNEVKNPEKLVLV